MNSKNPQPISQASACENQRYRDVTRTAFQWYEVAENLRRERGPDDVLAHRIDQTVDLRDGRVTIALNGLEVRAIEAAALAGRTPEQIEAANAARAGMQRAAEEERAERMRWDEIGRQRHADRLRAERGASR